MIYDDKKSPEQEQEIILAEEQSVNHKTGFLEETQGALVLTNKKLVFVGADQEIDFRTSPVITPGSMVHFRFSVRAHTSFNLFSRAIENMY